MASQSKRRRDSAAEITLLDTTFAQALGLVATGTETARGTGSSEPVGLIEGVAIEALGIAVPVGIIAVLSLADISERSICEPVHLVMGRELFAAGRLFLDIDSSRLTLVGPDALPRGVRLDLVEDRGIKQLPVSIEGRDVLADFDIGNGGIMLIGCTFATVSGTRSNLRNRTRRWHRRGARPRRRRARNRDVRERNV